MKDTKSILLGMLSLGLVGTWGFYFYEKLHKPEPVKITDPVAVEHVRDSLRSVYNGTLEQLDTKLDSTRSNADSLQQTLDQKLSEINALRFQIDSLLHRQNSSPDELNLARVRINELQRRVNDLTNQKASMQEEKDRLVSLLAELSGKTDGIRNDIVRLNNENRELNKQVSQSAVFTVSDLRITPGEVSGDNNQLDLSFTVRNTSGQFSGAEVYVVVIQPDGKVMRTDIWEAAYIDTRSYGRKLYTQKLRFDYQKGENKHLSLQIPADEFQRGNYTLQLFQNGYLIGQAVRVVG